MKKKFVCIYICLILLVPLISTAAIANQPPSTPHIDGPTSSKPRVKESYGFCSEDPDGDKINFTINWGDGPDVVVGPVPTGVCAILEHAWSEEGTYKIKAKASDGQADSDWAELDVIIPRSRTINSFLHWFIQMFPILRFLVQLY